MTLVQQEPRAFARQNDSRFSVVQIALTDAYRPVTSGAFTLTENYALTVEAFSAYLNLLEQDGLLLLTRWLQNPPSEEVRALGLILAALDPLVSDPAQHVVAFRSFQTMTFVVKRAPFTAEEIARVLAEAERLKYDMVLAPGLPPETINRYARLPEPVYHITLTHLLEADDRAAFYATYDFDVRPPTDDRPFFFHFFRWRQTPEILDNLGRTWQPWRRPGWGARPSCSTSISIPSPSCPAIPPSGGWPRGSWSRRWMPWGGRWGGSPTRRPSISAS
ncbi:MAG: hypothetical protein BWX88_05333 [Planctomycetes bacterium ADurb.Bin126]|nr:MAG: hypothetical protein BWX88_05333 [Planctomycetes bacterium ADurb.Bin126]